VSNHAGYAVSTGWNRRFRKRCSAFALFTKFEAKPFKVRPKILDADMRMVQALHPGGILVALFDGSVRTIRVSVDESMFWSMVTPNWGEVISLE
jgi:hypothetical protein